MLKIKIIDIKLGGEASTSSGEAPASPMILMLMLI
jgi:hypothetical protein